MRLHTWYNFMHTKYGRCWHKKIWTMKQINFATISIFNFAKKNNVSNFFSPRLFHMQKKITYSHTLQLSVWIQWWEDPVSRNFRFHMQYRILVLQEILSFITRCHYITKSGGAPPGEQRCMSWIILLSQ